MSLYFLSFKIFFLCGSLSVLEAAEPYYVSLDSNEQLGSKSSTYQHSSGSTDIIKRIDFTERKAGRVFLPVPQINQSQLVYKGIQSAQQDEDFGSLIQVCFTLFKMSMGTQDKDLKMILLGDIWQIVLNNIKKGYVFSDEDQITLTPILFSYAKQLLDTQNTDHAGKVFAYLYEALSPMLWLALPSSKLKEFQKLSFYTNYYLCLLSRSYRFKVKLCYEIISDYHDLDKMLKKELSSCYLFAMTVNFYSCVKGFPSGMYHIDRALLNQHVQAIEDVMATLSCAQSKSLGLLPMYLSNILFVLRNEKLYSDSKILLDAVHRKINRSIEDVSAERVPGWGEEYLRLTAIKSFFRPKV